MNISNGGTVTAITLTNNGGGSGGYSSFPSITISPPTTAGGVQATATVLVMQPITASIQSGGSGYTLNDIVSWVGGTPQTIAATFRVSGVSGGVVTAVTAVNFAPYLVLPTTPVSTTGGTGTGLTLTGLFYAVGGTFTITNAGSGYVEQPTVTFSGGGGSGAAAYATVGGATTIRGLGSATAGNISDSILFRTPSGTSFSVGERAATTVNYFTAIGNGSGGQAILRAIGSDTNVSATIGSQGTGSVQFHTNTTSGNLQMQVSHTASAVNYVQVTGAAATGAPTFSGQGSDTNISLQYVAKGTGIHVFQSGTSFNQFVVAATNSSVNYVQVTGAATGGRPTISAQGSDTNVGMVYNTKGAQNHVFSTNAGNLQFVVANRASTVNWAQVIGATAGFGPAYTVEGSDTNIPVILQPKGSGGLQAQQTDATTTGGNARGGRAVDWQTLRSAASQVASGFVATASGGYNNTVSGGVSVVGGGTQNTAAADLSSILGGIANSTPSSGAGNTYSFIGAGYQNNASGVFNVIGGGYLNSGTATAAVTTQSGTMNGTTAVTLSGSNASIKVGQLVTGTSIQGFPNTYVAAISGTSLTLSQVASGSSTSTLSFFTPHGVVVGGGNNQATGSYSFIGGGGDAGTAAFRNQASGDWSVVVGGIQNSATNTYASVLGGANTSATGAYSVSLGGAGNSSSGFGSTNLGGNGNVANGTYAVAGGYSSTNRSIATFAFAAGNASRNGDAQAEMFVLRNITTDATPAVLTTNAAAAGTTTQVILPNNAAYHFKGSVIANVTGAANGAAWEFSGAIMRGANAASTVLINTPSINRIAASSGATAWTIALTADTTNGGLAVTVTGAASTTIRWVAKLETTEVTF
jgi:hypothetical protein